MIAVSIAPPAPPAISCETTPPTLRLPDSAAATTDGSANVTIWPSTPPPTKPKIMLPIVPRSKLGDALPVATPPSAPAMRFIRICIMLIPPMTANASLLQPHRSPSGDKGNLRTYAQLILTRDGLKKTSLGSTHDFCVKNNTYTPPPPETVSAEGAAPAQAAAVPLPPLKNQKVIQLQGRPYSRA